LGSWPTLLGVSLGVALTGCERPPPPKPRSTAPAEAPRPPSPLIGAWRVREPVLYSGDGVTVETRDSRTEYLPDGRFVYVARLRVSGGRLPNKGLGLGMSAEGRWTLRHHRLTERFTGALIRPDGRSSPQLDLLAQAMSDEAAQRKPSQSDVLRLDAKQLVLRDRDTQQTITYVRSE